MAIINSLGKFKLKPPDERQTFSIVQSELFLCVYCSTHLKQNQSAGIKFSVGRLAIAFRTGLIHLEKKQFNNLERLKPVYIV